MNIFDSMSKEDRERLISELLRSRSVLPDFDVWQKWQRDHGDIKLKPIDFSKVNDSADAFLRPFQDLHYRAMGVDPAIFDGDFSTTSTFSTAAAAEPLTLEQFEEVRKKVDAFMRDAGRSAFQAAADESRDLYQCARCHNFWPLDKLNPQDHACGGHDESHAWRPVDTVWTAPKYDEQGRPIVYAITLIEDRSDFDLKAEDVEEPQDGSA